MSSDSCRRVPPVSGRAKSGAASPTLSVGGSAIGKGRLESRPYEDNAAPPVRVAQGLARRFRRSVALLTPPLAKSGSMRTSSCALRRTILSQSSKEPDLISVQLSSKSTLELRFVMAVEAYNHKSTKSPLTGFSSIMMNLSFFCGLSAYATGPIRPEQHLCRDCRREADPVFLLHQIV